MASNDFGRYHNPSMHSSPFLQQLTSYTDSVDNNIRHTRAGRSVVSQDRNPELASLQKASSFYRANADALVKKLSSNSDNYGLGATRAELSSILAAVQGSIADLRMEVAAAKRLDHHATAATGHNHYIHTAPPSVPSRPVSAPRSIARSHVYADAGPVLDQLGGHMTSTYLKQASPARSFYHNQPPPMSPSGIPAYYPNEPSIISNMSDGPSAGYAPTEHISTVIDSKIDALSRRLEQQIDRGLGAQQAVMHAAVQASASKPSTPPSQEPLLLLGMTKAEAAERSTVHLGRQVATLEKQVAKLCDDVEKRYNDQNESSRAAWEKLVVVASQVEAIQLNYKASVESLPAAELLSKLESRLQSAESSIARGGSELEEQQKLLLALTTAVQKAGQEVEASNAARHRQEEVVKQLQSSLDRITEMEVKVSSLSSAVMAAKAREVAIGIHSVQSVDPSLLETRLQAVEDQYRSAQSRDNIRKEQDQALMLALEDRLHALESRLAADASIRTQAITQQRSQEQSVQALTDRLSNLEQQLIESKTGNRQQELTLQALTQERTLVEGQLNSIKAQIEASQQRVQASMSQQQTAQAQHVGELETRVSALHTSLSSQHSQASAQIQDLSQQLKDLISRQDSLASQQSISRSRLADRQKEEMAAQVRALEDAVAKLRTDQGLLKKEMSDGQIQTRLFVETRMDDSRRVVDNDMEELNHRLESVQATTRTLTSKAVRDQLAIDVEQRLQGDLERQLSDSVEPLRSQVKDLKEKMSKVEQAARTALETTLQQAAASTARGLPVAEQMVSVSPAVASDVSILKETVQELSDTLDSIKTQMQAVAKDQKQALSGLRRDVSELRTSSEQVHAVADDVASLHRQLLQVQEQQRQLLETTSTLKNNLHQVSILEHSTETQIIGLTKDIESVRKAMDVLGKRQGAETDHLRQELEGLVERTSDLVQDVEQLRKSSKAAAVLAATTRASAIGGSNGALQPDTIVGRSVPMIGSDNVSTSSSQVGGETGQWSQTAIELRVDVDGCISSVKALARDVKDAKESIKEVQSKVSTLIALPDQVDTLQALPDKLQGLQGMVEQLAKTVESAQAASAEVGNLARAESVEPDAQDVGKKLEMMQETTEQLYNQLQEQEYAVDQLKSRVEEVEEELSTIPERYRDMREIRESVAGVDKGQQGIQARIENLEQSYDELRKDTNAALVKLNHATAANAASISRATTSSGTGGIHRGEFDHLAIRVDEIAEHVEEVEAVLRNEQQQRHEQEEENASAYEALAAAVQALSEQSNAWQPDEIVGATSFTEGSFTEDGVNGGSVMRSPFDPRAAAPVAVDQDKGDGTPGSPKHATHSVGLHDSVDYSPRTSQTQNVLETSTSSVKDTAQYFERLAAQTSAVLSPRMSPAVSPVKPPTSLARRLAMEELDPTSSAAVVTRSAGGALGNKQDPAATASVGPETATTKATSLSVGGNASKPTSLSQVPRILLPSGMSMTDKPAGAVDASFPETIESEGENEPEISPIKGVQVDAAKGAGGRTLSQQKIGSPSDIVFSTAPGSQAAKDAPQSGVALQASDSLHNSRALGASGLGDSHDSLALSTSSKLGALPPLKGMFASPVKALPSLHGGKDSQEAAEDDLPTPSLIPTGNAVRALPAEPASHASADLQHSAGDAGLARHGSIASTSSNKDRFVRSPSRGGSTAQLPPEIQFGNASNAESTVEIQDDDDLADVLVDDEELDYSVHLSSANLEQHLGGFSREALFRSGDMNKASQHSFGAAASEASQLHMSRFSMADAGRAMSRSQNLDMHTDNSNRNAVNHTDSSSSGMSEIAREASKIAEMLSGDISGNASLGGSRSSMGNSMGGALPQSIVNAVPGVSSRVGTGSQVPVALAHTADQPVQKSTTVDAHPSPADIIAQSHFSSRHQSAGQTPAVEIKGTDGTATAQIVGALNAASSDDGDDWDDDASEVNSDSMVQVERSIHTQEAAPGGGQAKAATTHESMLTPEDTADHDMLSSAASSLSLPSHEDGATQKAGSVNFNSDLSSAPHSGTDFHYTEASPGRRNDTNTSLAMNHNPLATPDSGNGLGGLQDAAPTHGSPRVTGHTVFSDDDNEHSEGEPGAERQGSASSANVASGRHHSSGQVSSVLQGRQTAQTLDQLMSSDSEDEGQEGGVLTGVQKSTAFSNPFDSESGELTLPRQQQQEQLQKQHGLSIPRDRSEFGFEDEAFPQPQTAATARTAAGDMAGARPGRLHEDQIYKSLPDMHDLDDSILRSDHDGNVVAGGGRLQDLRSGHAVMDHASDAGSDDGVSAPADVSVPTSAPGPAMVGDAGGEWSDEDDSVHSDEDHEPAHVQTRGHAAHQAMSLASDIADDHNASDESEDDDEVMSRHERKARSQHIADSAPQHADDADIEQVADEEAEYDDMEPHPGMYVVEIKTGSKVGSSIDKPVYVVLEGSDGDVQLELENPGPDGLRFQRGDIDIIDVDVDDSLGEITGIKLWHGGESVTETWYVEHVQVSHPFTSKEYSIAVNDWIRHDEDAARFYRPGRRTSAAGSQSRTSAAGSAAAGDNKTPKPGQSHKASFDEYDDEMQTQAASRQMPVPTLSHGMGPQKTIGDALAPRAAATGRAGFGDASMSLDLEDSDESIPMYSGSGTKMGAVNASGSQPLSWLASNSAIGANTTSRPAQHIPDSFDDDDDEKGMHDEGSAGSSMVDDDEVAGMLFGGGSAMSSLKPSTQPQSRSGISSGTGSKLGSTSGLPARPRPEYAYDHLGVLEDEDIEDIKPTVGYGSGVSSTVISPAAVAPRNAVGSALSSMSGTGVARQSTQGTSGASGQRTSAGRDAGWNMTAAALGLSLGDSDEVGSGGGMSEDGSELSMPDNSSYVPSSVARRG